MNNQFRILRWLGFLAACFTASFAVAEKPRYAVVTDMTHYKWWHYQEAGSYPKAVPLTNHDSPRATMTMPEDCGTNTIHLILEVRDDGKPALVAYRRAIVTTPP